MYWDILTNPNEKDRPLLGSTNVESLRPSKSPVYEPTTKTWGRDTEKGSRIVISSEPPLETTHSEESRASWIRSVPGYPDVNTFLSWK